MLLTLKVLGEKPAQTQEEHANSAQKVTGSLCNFKIPNFAVAPLLCDDGARKF